MNYRCPLANLQPVKLDPEQVKRDGWRDQKILVVKQDDDRLNWLERETIRQIGEKLYGTRGDRT